MPQSHKYKHASIYEGTAAHLILLFLLSVRSLLAFRGSRSPPLYQFTPRFLFASFLSFHHYYFHGNYACLVYSYARSCPGCWGALFNLFTASALMHSFLTRAVLAHSGATRSTKLTNLPFISTIYINLPNAPPNHATSHATTFVPPLCNPSARTLYPASFFVSSHFRFPSPAPHQLHIMFLFVHFLWCIPRTPHDATDQFSLPYSSMGSFLAWFLE